MPQPLISMNEHEGRDPLASSFANHSMQSLVSTASLRHPSTSGLEQPRVTVSSPGASQYSLVPVVDHPKPRSHTTPTLHTSASQPILDSCHQWFADVSKTAQEPVGPGQDCSGSMLGNLLSFDDSHIIAGGNVASGNVSQQGNGNVITNIYNQHVPPEETHQDVLHHIRGKLKSYLAADATLNKDIHHEPSVCYKGTREKLLEHILAWVAAENSPDVSSRAKCIVGAPGSGKSTILNTLLIKLLQDAARRSPGLIAAHYCIRRSVHSTTDGSKVLPTLIFQLADRDYGVAICVSQSLRSHLQTGVLAPEFLEDLFIQAVQSYQRTVFLIVDALDEANHPLSLATILSGVIPRSPTNLRLLLATRNEHGVLHGLGEDLALKIVHEILTDQSVNDVRDYIHRRLKDGVMALFGNNPGWKYWPDNSQIRSLSDRAGGLFIWARTAVDYILFRLERRGKVDRDQWIQDVESLGTADVNRLYMFILEKQLGSGEEGDDKSEEDVIRAGMTGVFGFIIVAEHPLALNDLVGFLDFDFDFDVAHFVNMARSILVPGTKPITGSTVPTMHKTFFDFVTTERASAFRVDIEHHHRKAANQCFASMDAHLRFNIYGLSSSFKEYKTSSLVKRLPGGVLYASTKWWYHVQEGDSGVLSSYFDPLQTLLFNKFLFWLEVVSLDKETFEAAQSWISGLVKQLRPRPIPRTKLWISQIRRQIFPKLPSTTRVDRTGLAAFAEEALLLMERFKTCIHASVPHIYVSLLCFSPAASIVASHYRNKASTMVVPHPHGFPSVWDSSESNANSSMVDNGRVYSISFSPCGLRLATGYENSSVRVWDVETGECGIGPLKGHSAGVNTVCFSPNGLLIASGSDDKTIRVWDSETGNCMLGPLTGHTEVVGSVSFSPDSTRIASGSADDTVRVWDVRTGDCVLGPLVGHGDVINCISYSPDGSCIASGSDDTTILLWHAQTGECLRGLLAGHERSILSLSFHPDGRRFVSSSYDKTLRIWDIQEGTCTHGPLAGHVGWVLGVCFSPDGRYIASGSEDRTIRIWDIETAVCVAGPFGGASRDVSSVAFSPDGKYLAAGSWDGTVRLWGFNALLNAGLRDAAREAEGSTNIDTTDHAVLSKDGWMCAPSGEPLFWAPEPFRSAIWRPSTIRILGRPTMIKPDLSKLVTGREWLDCFPRS